MLYNMAMIQGRLKDYMACEVLVFRAIALLEPLKRYKQLYYCYNLLGVISEELEAYAGAIQYHQKAMDYLERVEHKKAFIPHSLNNIGILHQKQGDQPGAITHFEEALRILQPRSSDISLYARLLDNRAYSRLLAGDTTGLPQDFYTALQLRDSTGNRSGVIMSKQHLAEYYAALRDTTRAITYAKAALLLAQELRNNRDVLKTLLLLSNLDRAVSNTYLQQYIGLSKDLRDQERKVRDKFARVQYETDRYMERTQQLSSQKTWILTIGIGLLFIMLFLYILYRQQAKTKMLHLETAQQKANEQVYLITLKQHERLQEVRNQERIRISKVLHGAIISELFAIRMHWGLLLLEGGPEAMREHKNYLKKLKHLEREIREASHALIGKLVFYPLNLVHMVEKLTESRCRTLTLEPEVRNDENIPWNKVDLFIKTQLYHIISEGLQNCIKHARANRITIRFVRQGRYLLLTIQDNGQGFRPHKRQKGIGLMHIQSRVHKLRGKFRVDTAVGQGSTLTVSVPAFKSYEENDRKSK
ncbi:tetratricopeptide repeat-containing sensor histidine kinase [Sinomicrobium sp. M5D2P17]